MEEINAPGAGTEGQELNLATAEEQAMAKEINASNELDYYKKLKKKYKNYLDT